jgi:hypothetical protein
MSANLQLLLPLAAAQAMAKLLKKAKGVAPKRGLIAPVFASAAQLLLAELLAQGYQLIGAQKLGC